MVRVGIDRNPRGSGNKCVLDGEIVKDQVAGIELELGGFRPYARPGQKRVAPGMSRFKYLINKCINRFRSFKADHVAKMDT